MTPALLFTLRVVFGFNSADNNRDQRKKYFFRHIGLKPGCSCAVYDLDFLSWVFCSSGAGTFSFFPAICETRMLISYRIIRGPAINVCVNTSGGVRIAAPINMTTSEYLRFFRSQVALMSPSLVSVVSSIEKPQLSK